MIQRSLYNASVDWWSLGVMIHKMLLGYSPFIGDNKYYLFKSIVHDIVSCPAWMSYQSVSIIKGTIQLNLLTQKCFKKCFHVRIPQYFVYLGLLIKNPLQRIGCSGSFDSDLQIRNHSFFKGINWKQLELRRVKPPFRPTIVCIHNFIPLTYFVLNDSSFRLLQEVH